MTMLSAPLFTGAATITFFTPEAKYASSVSVVRNLPLHSRTISTSAPPTARRQASRTAEKPTAVTVDLNLSADRLDASGPPAVHRVERQEVRRRLRATRHFVDVHEFQVGPAPSRPQRQPTHPAEPVDPDSCRHSLSRYHAHFTQESRTVVR